MALITGNKKIDAQTRKEKAETKAKELKKRKRAVAEARKTGKNMQGQTDKHTQAIAADSLRKAGYSMLDRQHVNPTGKPKYDIDETMSKELKRRGYKGKKNK